DEFGVQVDGFVEICTSKIKRVLREIGIAAGIIVGGAARIEFDCLCIVSQCFGKFALRFIDAPAPRISCGELWTQGDRLCVVGQCQIYLPRCLVEVRAAGEEGWILWA